jgi:hypothetical protein
MIFGKNGTEHSNTTAQQHNNNHKSEEQLLNQIDYLNRTYMQMCISTQEQSTTSKHRNIATLRVSSIDEMIEIQGSNTKHINTSTESIMTQG